MSIIAEYKLIIADKHEFDHPIYQFTSSTPFGAFSRGDYIKPTDISNMHPGQAFTHQIVDIYHYIHPEGANLSHKIKLIVEKSRDPNNL